MAQATSDPPEVKVCSSRMVSPAQTSAQFLCLNMSMASSSTGKRKTEPHRVGRRKSILEIAGPVSILLAVGRAFSSPQWALSAACLDPHPRGNARGVSLSVTQCYPLWLHCSILWTFDLPFLWIFPPLTPYCLPSLLLEYFLPEVCQTHNHLFACPCFGRTSSKGSNNKDLFICFLFFVYFKHFLPSSPPPSPQ